MATAEFSKFAATLSAILSHHPFLGFEVAQLFYGIPSPALALFVVMLSKAHLTSHSRTSSSRSVITPLWYLARSYRKAILVSVLKMIDGKRCVIKLLLLSRWQLMMAWSKVEFLNLSTIDILDWIILCYGECPVHWQMFGSIYGYACMLGHFSHVQLCGTLWTIACQGPLSMGFSTQEYWSGLPCPSPGDLPDPGIEPVSLMFPTLARHYVSCLLHWLAGSLPLEPPEKPF